ncbi:hypothetical protein [Variovorax paradoxus]|uniref:Uncharacterized protein n=1 Tax=Variovorax paradoxus TaxID=34073 RepID=A0A679IR37_VARPD|nr:hypothetical protein VVAX_01845 [Variovorax paradoxus]
MKAAAARRIVIDRLELDLRGIDPATAQAAARLLGPALSRALQQRDFTARSTERLDAGRIDSPASSQPAALAARIARQIARQASTPRTDRKTTP